MTERPNSDNQTELRRSVFADEVDLPVITHHHFPVGPSTALLGGEEFVPYAALGTGQDGGPALLGCARDPATARGWVAGTLVRPVAWTTTERVAALPEATAAMAEAGRSVTLAPPGATSTTDNVATLIGGAPAWVARNVDEDEGAESWAVGKGFGAAGSGNGLFAGPWDAAVAPNGDIWVVDRDNHRIQRFSPSGAWLQTVGGPASGSGNGQFNAPAGIAVALDGSVYVCDAGNSRVQKFSPAGVYQTQWGTFGAATGEFRAPQGIAVDQAGAVYVADTDNHRVQKFDAVGGFLAAWGTQGAGDGRFDQPTAVEADRFGNVWVADSYNHRVQRFSNGGAFLAAFGGRGNAPGQLNRPSGIAVDLDGNVWVGDYGNHRAQKLSPDGGFLAAVGSFGGGSGRVRYPIGLVVGPYGAVYLADYGNDRIATLVPVDAGGTAGGYTKEPEDFNGGSTTPGSIGDWNWNAGGNGSVTYQPSTKEHPGILRIGSGGVAGNLHRINFGPFVVDTIEETEFIFSPVGSIPTANLRVGLADVTATPGHGVYAEMLAGETTWFIVKAVGGVLTRTNTGIGVVAGAWYRFRVRRTASGIVEATVTRNDTLQTVGATASGLNLSAQLLLFFLVATTTNAGRQLDCDFATLRTSGISRV